MRTRLPGKNADKIERIFSKAQDSLVLQSSDLSLESIANMVDKKSINIEPRYQRRERWSPEKQSALIESFLLNIPIPPVYLMEEEYGDYSVIDGKQRIISIYLFMKNKLKLIGLDKFIELEGKIFGDLPTPLTNALNIRPYLRVVTLLRQSDKDLKYEVFLRLNKGGEPLLPQEIRNVAFRGPLNDLLFELSQNSFLLKQLKIESKKERKYKEMVDVSYVLRFFVIRESWERFSGEMDSSMDNFMENHKNDDNRSLAFLKGRFNRALKGCRDIWRDKAFKRPADRWINLMVQGMYDAQMVAVDNLNRKELENAVANRDKVIENMKYRLKKDQDFEDSIRQFTSNPNRMKYRISEMIKVLKSV